MKAKSYGRTIEINHIVSLELGGSNDIANLFPEPGKGTWSYHRKDKLENKLHAIVCAGKNTLSHGSSPRDRTELGRRSTSGSSRGQTNFARRRAGVTPCRPRVEGKRELADWQLWPDPDEAAADCV